MQLTRVFLLLLLLTSTSCLRQKKLVYFQASKHQDTIPALPDSSNIAIIQPGDILNIFVTSVSAEASQYFNYSDESADQSSMANGYLVDPSGNIQVPLVGNIMVANMSTAVARDTITKRLEKYVINPSVKLSIRNFRVTVIGEVVRPGVYTVLNERISLPDALALAGDFTVFSNRQKIMIIRDVNGIKEFANIDYTRRDIFTSPYYNLNSGDIVYVEPLKNKRFAAENYYRVLPVLFSGVTILLTTLTYISRE